MTRRERREARRDREAATRLLCYLLGSIGHETDDDDLLVEAWLWMVLGEDDAAAACLEARTVPLAGQESKWERLR